MLVTELLLLCVAGAVLDRDSDISGDTEVDALADCEHDIDVD